MFLKVKNINRILNGKAYMKSRNIFLPVLLLVCMLLTTMQTAAYAGEGLVVDSGKGSIDWGQGNAFGTSSIVPMQDSIDPHRTRALAVRQGGVQARNNLLSALLAVSVDGDSTVRQRLDNKYKALRELRGYVQNSLLKTEVVKQGEVKVKAFVSLRGEIASILYPSSIPFLSGIAPTLGQRDVVTEEFTEDMQEESDDYSAYSGIVIDARGVEVNPVLLPTVYDGRGVGVYGAFAVSRANALGKGLAGYYAEPQSKEYFNRVGSNPLWVSLVNTHGRSRSDLVVSIEDGARIKAVLKNDLVESNCAVAVIISAPESEKENAVRMDEGTSAESETALERKIEEPEEESIIMEESLVPDNKSHGL